MLWTRELLNAQPTWHFWSKPHWYIFFVGICLLIFCPGILHFCSDGSLPCNFLSEIISLPGLEIRIMLKKNWKVIPSSFILWKFTIEIFLVLPSGPGVFFEEHFRIINGFLLLICCYVAFLVSFFLLSVIEVYIIHGIYPFHLSHWLANHSPLARSGPWPTSLAAPLLHQLSGVVPEAVQPAKPKTFTAWLLTEEVCPSLDLRFQTELTWASCHYPWHIWKIWHLPSFHSCCWFVFSLVLSCFSLFPNQAF